MEPNFSGYVTKAGLKCADGRTIMPEAFAHQDGAVVPLVYQHNHTDISQVLGKVRLSKREDGVWGDAFLNESSKAKDAGIAVEHGDLDKFSIWAKNLDERGYQVFDGDIQEVSLVLAGSNAGAKVANVLVHGILDPDDDFLVVGGDIKHDSVATEEKPAAKETEVEETEEKPAEKTREEVLNGLDDEERKAVNSFIDDFVKEALTEALTEEPEVQHDNLDSEKGTQMSRNLFDRSNQKADKPELKHSDVTAILNQARADKVGSLRDLIRSSEGKELMHADDYGIQNVEVLFPDAQALMNRPTFVDRRQEWVKAFLGGTSHSPFSRVKTVYADITADEARARGYIKAHQKVDEVFPVFKRQTGPAWIYKRQKLDRQDIIDIVDFDVVAWMKVEMRGKMDEELARAGLFGDGRPTLVNGEMNPDKVQDPGADNNNGNGIRAIVNDNDLYASRYSVPLPENPVNEDWNIFLDTVTEAQEYYMGSGNKTAFMSYRTASKLLTMRDGFGHRIYKNLSEVAGDMDVTKIERVPTELMPSGVLAIVLDLRDYNFGADKGGELTLFDDFDIDFNQWKYLMEVYLSGALTLPYSAQIFVSVESTDVNVEPTQPTFEANVVTIPTQTGVTYKNADTGATLAAASTVTLTGEEGSKQVKVEAFPDNGYYFDTDADFKDSWTFRYKAQ